MSRCLTCGLTTLIVSFLTTSPALAQVPPVRSTLDAKVPSDHEYVVATWFKKKDKSGTFESSIMDPSIPGSYDRQAWEKAKQGWNTPNGSGVMRIFSVHTSKNAKMTERQQVMARIEEERQRIEVQNPVTVAVKRESKEKSNQEAQKDEGKTTSGNDENAKKPAQADSMAGTRWIRVFRGGQAGDTFTFMEDGKLENSAGTMSHVWSWKQIGDTVWLLNGGLKKETYFREGDHLYYGDYPALRNVVAFKKDNRVTSP